MTKISLVSTAAAVIILLFSGIAHSGKLADAFGPLITKYPPPAPTAEERNTLAWAYEQLAKQKPKDVFEKKCLIVDEIDRNTRPGSLPDNNTQKLYYKKLRPFAEIIRTASIHFDVPQEIIGAVIIQESGGNPKAHSPKSSAKGLMQTIDATFELAGKRLAGLGISIHDPYDPYDSIMAGTWYLSYVFELAKQDYPEYGNRTRMSTWNKALEYYYAGPNWGKDPNPVVRAQIGGKTIVIKKQWYADNVMGRAKIL